MTATHIIKPETKFRRNDLLEESFVIRYRTFLSPDFITQVVF